MNYLPKITLKADFNNGDGEIGNLIKWRECINPLLRADILQDWVALLDAEYWVAREDMKKEYEENSKRKLNE